MVLIEINGLEKYLTGLITTAEGGQRYAGEINYKTAGFIPV